MTSTPFKGLIIDLNGTLYFKEQQIDGAAEVIQTLRQQNYILRFVTNTDTQTRVQLHKMLLSYGLDIREEEIFSANHSTYAYLKSMNYSYTGLLPANLEAEFADLGRDDEHPDCVLVGENQKDINYATLDRMFRHLMNGAELIVMQPNRYYFLANGPHLDTGSIGAMFEYATGMNARVMAKPSLSFFTTVLKDMRLNANQVAVIGDDVETDILGAAKIGAFNILVQTGKYRPGDEMLAAAKPRHILASIKQLPDYLSKHAQTY